MAKTLCLLVGMCVLAVALTSDPALADDKPIQLGLFTPVQIVPEDESVKGLRLSLIYGRNTTVKGLDWGLVTHTTEGVSKGWQLGLIGIVEADFLGFQDNALNIVQGKMEGFQWGAVNYSRSMSGLQLGLVNVAERMYGLQIGLVNVIQQDGFLPFFPIVNWSF